MFKKVKRLKPDRLYLKLFPVCKNSLHHLNKNTIGGEVVIAVGCRNDDWGKIDFSYTKKYR